MKRIFTLLLLTSCFNLAQASQFTTEILHGASNVWMVDLQEGHNDSSRHDVEHTFGIRQLFRYNEAVSFELVYNDYRTAKNNIYGASWNSRGAGVKYEYPLRHDLILSAHTGLKRWEADFTSYDAQFDRSGLSPYLGIQIEYNLTELISLGFDYTVFNADVERASVEVAIDPDGIEGNSDDYIQEYSPNDYTVPVNNAAFVIAFKY